MGNLISTGGTGDGEGNNRFLELQAIINQAMAEQNNHLHQALAEIKEEQEMLKEEIAIAKEENEQLREMDLKKHRVTEHRYGFISLGDLGQMFDVSISSQRMGKLLRLVGIAMAGSSKTEPYRTAIQDGYAKSMMYGDFPTYQYNPDKCIRKIERWLEKREKLEEFFSIPDEKELAKYIDELYETCSGLSFN